LREQEKNTARTAVLESELQFGIELAVFFHPQANAGSAHPQLAAWHLPIGANYSMAQLAAALSLLKTPNHAINYGCTD
jgi:hypothetical protein